MRKIASQNAEGLQARLKRAMIKKFLHERINKKFEDSLLLSNSVPSKKYRVGVIDFLTDYGTGKKMETLMKGTFHSGDASEISC